MVFNQTQNSKVKLNLQDELKLNPLVDVIPSSVVPSIQPVFVTNLNYSTSGGSAGTATSAGAATAFTASATQDTYLTHLTFSISKDATCDAATGTLSAAITVNGATISLLGISHQTLTALQETVTIAFCNPIKVDKGTSVRATNVTFTAGACRINVSCTVMVKDSGLTTA